jgi:hypothetical protein
MKCLLQQLAMKVAIQQLMMVAAVQQMVVAAVTAGSDSVIQLVYGTIDSNGAIQQPEAGYSTAGNGCCYLTTGSSCGRSTVGPSKQSNILEKAEAITNVFSFGYFETDLISSSWNSG